MKERRPLFTLFVYAFNHEKFIREAIHGAFSQTYTPTEIILSDDCSIDKTWAIMQEMAEKYNGSHRLILNRNERNLGISDHLNRIMQLGSGDWFVLGAGDDISLPDRLQNIYNAIEQHPHAYGVATALLNIDEHGRQIHHHSFDAKYPYVTGASSAWHRKCFEFFGEITQKTTAEDIIIPFRSVLLGELLLIKTPTVKYRYHEDSVSNPLNQDLLNSWKHLLKIKYQLINACRQRLLDLDRAKHLVMDSTYSSLIIKHNDLIEGFTNDIESINQKCMILESNLKTKLFYLLSFKKNLPNKHRSFSYRLKTVIASYRFIHFFLKKKKLTNYCKDVKQIESIRAINIENLLNSEIGLLIYL